MSRDDPLKLTAVRILAELSPSRKCRVSSSAELTKRGYLDYLKEKKKAKGEHLKLECLTAKRGGCQSPLQSMSL